ncbi:hypothetical protein IscW_ISCW015704 [Ixodes scapularis]|uniref:Ionotropic glutamate receptor C-terminal domain-containing protein n=1 Tax=Ixodes scapularis TaxID=6945 RepID=B7P0Y9_IXOSC|nr:hypothetical protein IscW_ISCW015704 [Ixodes scapularis]|eukprot:XP_002399702.1 hypothetical protein IscW_ISCW015704 [Ixodes scapularis]
MRPILGVDRVNGQVKFDGIAWYVIQCLQQALRFSYVLQTTDEQLWSSRRPTGEWGGPLGMLERNESDITAHPVIPTADRITVGTPLPPYLYSGPRFFAGTPNPYMTSVFGYLMSFDLEVSTPQGRQPRMGSGPAVASAVIMNSSAAGGSVRPVRDVIGRIVISVWWLSALVLMNSFQGTMKASMSVKTPTERMETFQDLADRPHIKPILIRGTTFEHQFKVSKEPALRAILAMVRKHKSIMLASEAFTRKTFEELLSGRAILFMEDTVMKRYIPTLFPEKPKTAEFYASKQRTISAQFSMLMRKGLDPRIAGLLHVRCRWLHESGLLDKKRRDLQPHSWFNGRQAASSVHDLNIDDMVALFYMALLGLVVATVVFFLEIVAYKFFEKTDRSQRRATSS